MDAPAAVREYRPTLREALRLARRPIIGFSVFNVSGMLAILFVFFSESHSSRDAWSVPCYIALSVVASFIGMVVALRRIRAWLVLGLGFLCGALLIYVINEAHGGDKDWWIATLLSSFGFLSGFLALQHRFELFAGLLPSIGWIGGAVALLNRAGRYDEWQQSKHSVWLPVPLLLLLGFAVSLAVYLSQKQAYHLQLWQLLGGSPVTRRTSASRGLALRRRNVVAIGLFAALLFVFTAFLAPYLWRSGRGDHAGRPDSEMEHSTEPIGDRGDALGRILDNMAETLRRVVQEAKNERSLLGPLLLFLLLRRPIQRSLVVFSLRRPLWRRGPSRRIDDQWRYVRIALGDMQIPMLAADSVEEVVARAEKTAGCRLEPLREAARIYGRARYGLGLMPGDVLRAREEAQKAFELIRRPLPWWRRVLVWYRKVER